MSKDSPKDGGQPEMAPRPKRVCRRKLHFAPSITVKQEITLTPAEKKRVSNRAYKERIKADPDKYLQHLERDRLWHQRDRTTMSDEKKAKLREKNRVHNFNFRARKKMEALLAPPKKPAAPPTRQSAALAAAIDEERKAKNRESQRKRRSNMSVQKLRREKERNNAYYKEKKLLTSHPLHSSTPKPGHLQPVATPSDAQPATPYEHYLPVAFPSNSQPAAPSDHQPAAPSDYSQPAAPSDHSQPADPSDSQPAAPSNSQPASPSDSPPAAPHRSTIHRLKKRLGKGKKLLLSLKGLVKSVSKTDKVGLSQVGIDYKSPNKTKKVSLPSPLRKKRDIHTCIVKRLVRGLPTEGLYKRKSKYSSLVKGYYNNKAHFLPGKQGVTKTLIVKKALDKAIVALHKEFTETHGCIISRSTFFRLRPKNVLSFTKVPFRQCLCEICLNPMLKAKVLNSTGCVPRLTYLSQLIGLTLCGKNRECIRRECAECGVGGIDGVVESVNDLNVAVSWQRWERVKRKSGVRMDLVTKDGSVGDMVCELKSELFQLASHDFIHRWQSSQFSDLIENVPSKWAVAVLDFSENYLCVQQDQPQSAYFGYSQVTVHPCVLYYSCACGARITDNWVFVSDVLQHSADMVNCIVKRILSYLEDLSLSKVVVFSDGCASQYKSRLPFSYLQSYHSSSVTVQRSFFGSRHGKNPCDALGAVLKQAAKCAVKARKVSIQDASSLHSFASEKLSVLPSAPHGICTHMQRRFFLLDEADISSVACSSRPTHSLPGTRQVHDILSTPQGLLLRNLSCFCPPCVDGDFSSCHSSAHVDAWRLSTLFLEADILNAAFLESDDEHNLDDAFLESGDLDDSAAVSLPVDKSLPSQVSRSRECFFSEVQSMFTSCRSFDELRTVVGEISSSFVEFPLPDFMFQTVSSVDGNVDDFAMTKFSAMGISTLVPVETVGDGNCVPRSFSVHCFGSEDHHVEIRCRIVHELVSNAMDYLCLPQEDLSFLMSHSPGGSADSPESAFHQETLLVCRSSVCMGMWQVMAAANAFGTHILSVYPFLGPECYSSFYNKTCRARVPRLSSSHAFAIFWCATPEHEKAMPSDSWTANHVVPLLPREEPVLVDVD